MTTAHCLLPLLEQFDFAHERLLGRPADPLMDAEYRWEPAPGCWSVRRREDGPGERAAILAGSGP